MIYNHIKKLLFILPAETAHSIATFILRCNLLPNKKCFAPQILEQKIHGLTFPNPIGLSAGFDKNAEMLPALSKQGFGFIEAGTVTIKPQIGNPKPRIFRLEEDEAIINRLGFNGKGAKHFKHNLKKSRKQYIQAIIGSNIGKNKDSLDAESDYIKLLTNLYTLSDYITINISSPNTSGLRDLQKKEAFLNMVKAIKTRQKELYKTTNKFVPIFFKIAPDITVEEAEDIAKIALDEKVDGLIISNTTIARNKDLKSQHALESGGLSGKPLLANSTKLLAQIYKLTQGKIPLIGVGGVSNAEDAYKKIRNGASLVQIYSALIYHGMGLPSKINHDLIELLRKDGFTSIRDAIGIDVKN
jgi:dihydroorotate dehydrogenase